MEEFILPNDGTSVLGRLRPLDRWTGEKWVFVLYLIFLFSIGRGEEMVPLVSNW